MPAEFDDDGGPLAPEASVAPVLKDFLGAVQVCQRSIKETIPSTRNRMKQLGEIYNSYNSS